MFLPHSLEQSGGRSSRPRARTGRRMTVHASTMTRMRRHSTAVAVSTAEFHPQVAKLNVQSSSAVHYLAISPPRIRITAAESSSSSRALRPHSPNMDSSEEDELPHRLVDFQLPQEEDEEEEGEREDEDDEEEDGKESDLPRLPPKNSLEEEEEEEEEEDEDSLAALIASFAEQHQNSSATSSSSAANTASKHYATSTTSSSSRGGRSSR